ncbi:transcriptional regulator [Candidatus Poribacteria bacterium]|nr:transcriptional regulator [Candidatus Poribacteria bacterium]
MRTWREYLIDKFADREKAISYLQVALEEYQVDGDTAALMLALQTVVEAQGGIHELANRIHTAPQTALKMLSSDNTPTLDTLGTILNALGWRLSIEPLEEVIPSLE